MLMPADFTQRLSLQGRPVSSGKGVVITHCGTNQALAGTQISVQNDFGMEYTICAHTFTQGKKTQQLQNEYAGKPSTGMGNRNETPENYWEVLCHFTENATK